jgi:hypothetical protein
MLFGPRSFSNMALQSAVELLFVFVERFNITTVCRPAHPFWFGRQVPFVRIEVTNQPRLDPLPSELCPRRRILKLGVVGDLPTPGLPAAELTGSGRFPENGRTSTGCGAKEEPLMSSEVATPSDQSDELRETINNRYFKPGLVRIGHVGRYYTPPDLSPIWVAPPDAMYANVVAELDVALSS